MRFLVMVMVGVVAGPGAAAAQPSVEVLEPISLELPFGNVPYDTVSAPQRIRLRNVGDRSIEAIEVNTSGAGVQIAATGGGLGPGEEQYWDIVCAPVVPGWGSSFLDIILCADGCEIEIWETFIVECSSGLLGGPEGAVALPVVYQDEESRVTFSMWNVQPTTVTITEVVATPPFSGALESGTLPLALAPGESVNLVAEFDTLAPDGAGNLDLVADGEIVGRALLAGATLKQIAPLSWQFWTVPLGAVYTLPITIRNSSPMTRTITSASFDSAAFTVSDIVGTTVAPRQVLDALITLTATEIGTPFGTLTVNFDAAPNATSTVAAYVEPATFSVETADADATDGRLDFGTVWAGSPPLERSVTLVNQTDVARTVNTCSDPPPFELLGECPVTMPAGGRVDFLIRFAPISGSAFTNMFFNVEGVGGGGGGFLSVPISARVVNTRFALSAETVAFSDTPRGSVSQGSVTITNATADPLSVPVAVLGDGFALVGPATVALPAGVSAEVTVEFRPDAVGDFSGSLEVGAVDDPDRRSIALTGRATSPKVDCDAELDFGDVEVGATAEASVTLRNLDDARAIEITGLTVDGSGFTAVMPLVSTVEPGGSVEIYARFSPESAGAANGQLAIFLGGDTAPQATVLLRGEGVDADIGPRPPDEQDDGDGSQPDDEPGASGCAAGGRGGPGPAAILIVAALLLRRLRRRGSRCPRRSTDRGC